MASNVEPSTQTRSIGVFPFVIGGLSFIPLVGVLFGLIAIGWGLATTRRGGGKLALIGLGGIGFTIFVYGALFYFGGVQRGGVYDDLRSKMAQSSLNSLVNIVEVYKLKSGHYPESLDELKASLPKDSIDNVYLTDPRVSGFAERPKYFYYRRIDESHYIVRGVASDGKPFSPGALVPQVVTAGTNLGLVIDPPPDK